MLQGNPASFYNADFFCHIFRKISFLCQFLAMFQGQFLQDRIFLVLR